MPDQRPSADLLAELKRLGIVLWAEGDRLRFKAPDGALTPALKARLQEEKPRLLRMLAAPDSRATTSELPPIVRTTGGEHQLSHAQERLWFLEQLLPGNPTYNMPYAYRLQGALDLEALRRAFTRILERHEILRTELFTLDGAAHGRVAPADGFDVPLIQITGTTAGERQKAARVVIDELARRPFRLDTAPLMRAAVLELDETEHWLFLCLHHIVNDDWSLNLLWRELTSLYKSYRDGTAPDLPDVPLRYVDFASWQRDQLATGRFDEQIDYWRQQLREPLTPLGLQTDFARPPRTSYRGDVSYFKVPEPVALALRRVAQSQNATLFMVLAAAFKTLLHRYTGQPEVVIGTATAGRGYDQVDSVIGFFINTLALRTSLHDDPSFADLVGRVRRVASAAFENQDVPFERVIDAVRPERDTSRTPFFDVLLVLHRPPDRRRLDGLQIEQMPVTTGSAKFDLTMEVTEDDGGRLEGFLEFDSDLYEHQTIDRLGAHFVALLESIVAAPDTRVSALSLVPAAERAELAAWNATAAPYPEGPAHSLFDRQAAATPDRVAVQSGPMAWTYAALDAAANRIAHTLRARGVGRGQRVGLCLERSGEMLAAVLGVWKAGAAYVPLDPGFPAERLRYMAEDAALACVVSTRTVVAAVGLPRAQQILLDEDAALIAAQPATPVAADAAATTRGPADGAVGATPVRAATAADPAYVIYTSGSTGRPKGVVVPHGAVVNFLTSMAQAPGLRADDVLVAVTTLSFDIAVLELHLPLSVGAQVVIATREETLDGTRLASLLTRSGATAMQGTPVSWRLLLEAGWTARPGFKALVGGEALPKDLAEALVARGLAVWNLYGPTETTVWSTTGPVADPSRGIRIGRPIANTTIHILDAQQQVCPIGVPGEIYIGGAGVTLGYWQRPELTAEKFLPDPWALTPGARFYRTGDRGRWRADGTLEHLGRLDDQTKVRGFRIELGEIEAVLQEHASVKQAAVYVWEPKPGDARLVACCVATPGVPLASAAGLRQHLRTKLPDYMLPQHFVPVETIALTPNGKVDRRALPRPSGRGDDEAAHVAPRTPTEAIVAEIWAAVLALPQVSVESNFFALGGHSLKVMQVVARVRQTLGVDLAVRELFAAPTIARLAAVLDRQLASQQSERGAPATVADVATFADDANSAASTSAPAPRSMPPLHAGLADATTPGLSFAQQRLWFLDQVDTPSAAYVIPRVLHLTGVLDLQALETALTALVERHAALRTTFAEVNGVPMARVAPPVPVTLDVTVLDATQLPAALEAAATERLSLETGPLLRLRLYRVGPNEHALLMLLHHIVGDAWSCDVLWRELGVAYSAATRSETPAWEPLPVSYGDYAAWQRTWLQGPALEQPLSFWQTYLAGAPQVLELPADAPRPALESHRGAMHAVHVDSAVLTRLRDVAQREGTTLFMVLKAAFDVLLWRHTGQTDFLVGTPVTNRGQTALEGVIGLFVNTVVLRGDLSGDPSVTTLLTRVREQCLQAYAHQELPLEVLVEALQPERDLSRNPLFQVMLVFQPVAPVTPSMPGLSVTGNFVDRGAAQIDLSFYLQDTPDGLDGVFEYATDLFEPATVARLGTRWQTLLQALSVATPDTKVSALPVMPASEVAQIASWNATRVEYQRPLRLHQLIEQQVARTPDVQALTFDDRAMSYDELNRTSNRLARALRRRGVGPDVLVGVFAERSFDMVVSLLAILKAGGAYVPLDPSYPAERLAHMVDDARAPVVLAQRRLLPQLPATSAEVIDLDAAHADFASESTEALDDHGAPNDLAYVIFTSGSTGRPKGAMNEHRGICNRLLWMQETYGLTADDRILQKTPFSFDVSVWEFFWPLLTGARLVIAKPEGHKDAAYLVRTIQQHAITTLHFVPSMLRVFLEETGVEGCTSLKRVICSGEALPRELQDRLFARLPSVELHNLYGPTEAAVDVTYWECRRDDNRLSVPIGRPVANTQIHIVDSALKPTPVGVPGELYIGGVQVGRGYVARPELTAERFIPDPFVGTPDAHLYRTGDRARFLADGAIEYLGRLDFQVKIRGQRIELGEIEAILDTHAGVRQSVVMAREDTPGDQQLVAYVVSGPDAPDAEALRAHLANTLPVYMVPNTIVFLDAFPLNSSGKVDRRALPRPAASSGEGGYVPPRTPTEEILAGIWAQVLGAPRVSVDANFFAIGGHSLKVMQVMARVRQTLGVDLAVRELFVAPTVARLSSVIDAHTTRTTPAIVVPPLTPGLGDAGTAVLSFAQQRLWFLDQVEASSTAYVIPRALRLEGDLDVAALQVALNALVTRHAVLRATYGEADGAPVVRVAEPAAVTLTRADVSPADLPDVLSSALSERMSLSAGPLLRVRLYRLGPQEHVLLVLLHHIVSDAWSFEVLWRELGPAYSAAVQGEETPVAPLPVTYTDYAAWQRALLHGTVLDESLAYWRTQLAGAPQVLELPADASRPALESHRGGTHTVLVDVEIVTRLRAVAQREGTTLFMVLKAAFDILLWRYTGQTDFLVGVPVTNRDQTELENVVGLFVNTLVLRGDLSGDPTLTSILTRVREQCLQAYAHQELPLEVLVEALQPARDMSRNPLFQVMLVFQPGAPVVPALRGMKVTSVPVNRAAAQVDLSAYLQDTPDGLESVFEYATDLFEPATVARLGTHWQKLLEALSSAAPETKVSALQVVPASEIEQLAAWNATAAAYPDGPAHELFERQAAATPARIAVHSGATSWTYAALDAAANRIAHTLRARGVGRGQRVGLCLERSGEMLAAVLGVWKAGAAYVPLDPGFPAERLRYMAEDAALACVVSTRTVVAAVGLPRAQQILLDEDAALIAAQPATPVAADAAATTRGPADGAVGATPVRAATAADPAYVIYTSGSTGRPKGVVVPHGAVVNFLTSMAQAPGLRADDVLVAVTTLSFDIAVLELHLPLSVGAQVVIATREETLDGTRLASLLTRSGATAMQGTPVSWRLLLEAGWTARPGFKALVGGEALPKDLAEALVARGLAVWNLYGPTETTVWSTTGPVADPSRGIRIGRPIANTTIHILDAQQQVCPIGVPGEIYIGGAGVTLGYWQRPELTAEKFLPDPWALTPGARFYRTGDRGRWRADGTLEHLGRLDDQTKVRGFRIELGEIEAVLQEHASVKQAAVYVWEPKPGDARLVACCVAEHEGALAPTQLRKHLRTRLPEYMLPQHFVPVETIALTPNGKIDRRALPRPTVSEGAAVRHEAPRDADEQAIAEIWTELIRPSRPIGRTDKFFEMGGHSLLAMQALHKIEQRVGVRLGFGALFTESLADVAARCGRERLAGMSSAP